MCIAQEVLGIDLLLSGCYPVTCLMSQVAKTLPDRSYI